MKLVRRLQQGRRALQFVRQNKLSFIVGGTVVTITFCVLAWPLVSGIITFVVGSILAQIVGTLLLFGLGVAWLKKKGFIGSGYLGAPGPQSRRTLYFV